jgi:hypothetical protein
MRKTSAPEIPDESAVESLSDIELLSLCDNSLSEFKQEQLSDLLAQLREQTIADADRNRLDELMSEYRTGLVRKAVAMKEAVARGIRPRFSEDSA